MKLSVNYLLACEHAFHGTRPWHLSRDIPRLKMRLLDNLCVNSPFEGSDQPENVSHGKLNYLADKEANITYIKFIFISLNHLLYWGPSWPPDMRALGSESIFSLWCSPTVFQSRSFQFLLLGYNLFTLNSTGKENGKSTSIPSIEQHINQNQ